MGECCIMRVNFYTSVKQHLKVGLWNTIIEIYGRMYCKFPIESPQNAMASLSAIKGVAGGKSGWGCFPKGRRLRVGCGAELHIAAQAKFFRVLDGFINKSTYVLNHIMIR